MNGFLEHFERQVHADPQAIAIRSGVAGMTYAQLSSAAQRVAERLRSYAVQSLGIYLDNGIDWIVIDLAGMIAGIRVVPLPWFFSVAQITHAIADGGIDHVAQAADASPGTVLPPGILSGGNPVQLYRNCQLRPIAGVREATTALPPAGKLSYTSGSTGNPKGLNLTREFIDQTCTSVCSAVADLAIESHLSILPYATLLENVAGVYVPLMQGKTVHAEAAACVGLSPDLRLDPARLVQTFNRIRPGSLILTPQLLELLCLLAEKGAIDTECLAYVAVGGARVGEALISRARSAGIPAYEGYGLTEFGSVAILNTPASDRIGSAGRPLPGVSAVIAADGELFLATTLEHGRQRQIVSVRTGDLGSIDDDGFVFIHGRKSNLIVLSTGRNVSPEWIETELNASPRILQSYVFTETQADLSALLVARNACTTDAELEDEIDRINQALPRYARVARWYRLPQAFSRDNRTLTANGRLRRAQIEQLLPQLLAAANCAAPVIVGGFPNYSYPEMKP